MLFDAQGGSDTDQRGFGRFMTSGMDPEDDIAIVQMMPYLGDVVKSNSMIDRIAGAVAPGPQFDGALTEHTSIESRERAGMRGAAIANDRGFRPAGKGLKVPALSGNHGLKPSPGGPVGQPPSEDVPR